MVWTRGMGPGVQEGTPLVHDGVMYLPNPERLHPGDRRRHGRSDLGVQAQAARGPRRKFLPVPSINRNLAIYGNQIIDTSVGRFPVMRWMRVTGKLAWENAHRGLSRDAGAGNLRSHHRQRQDHFRRADASTSSAPTAASSPRMTRRPARNCGARAPSPSPASRATKPGAGFPTPSAATSAHGWCRATIPS